MAGFQPLYNGGTMTVATILLLIFNVLVFLLSLILIARKKHFLFGTTLFLFGFFHFHNGLSDLGRTLTTSHYLFVGWGGFFIVLGVVMSLWSLRRYFISSQADVRKRAKILKGAGLICLILTSIFFIFSLLGLYALLSVRFDWTTMRLLGLTYVEVLSFTGVGFTFFTFIKYITSKFLRKA